MTDLAGRVVVITGASRGLGLGMADWFDEQGAALGLCARSAIEFRPRRGVVQQVDVTEPQAVDEFCTAVAHQLGPIDMWVNNAGVLDPIGALRDQSPEEMARHLDINVKGVVHGMHTYLRHCHQTGQPGVLVNISSGAAQTARHGWALYGAGKAAVDHLSQAIAIEEADHDIRVLSVAPGVVDTDMQALIRAQDAADFPSVERFKAMKAEGSFNSPGWVAQHISEWAFGAPPDQVVVRVPSES